jgi:hypothetical protein
MVPLGEGAGGVGIGVLARKVSASGWLLKPPW